MGLMVALLLRFQYTGQNPHSRKKFALVLLVRSNIKAVASPAATEKFVSVNSKPLIYDANHLLERFPQEWLF
jgi:hypothetical protein